MSFYRVLSLQMCWIVVLLSISWRKVWIDVNYWSLKHTKEKYCNEFFQIRNITSVFPPELIHAGPAVSLGGGGGGDWEGKAGNFSSSIVLVRKVSTMYFFSIYKVKGWLFSSNFNWDGTFQDQENVMHWVMSRLDIMGMTVAGHSYLPKMWPMGFKDHVTLLCLDGFYLDDIKPPI